MPSLLCMLHWVIVTQIIVEFGLRWYTIILIEVMILIIELKMWENWQKGRNARYSQQ